MLSMTWKWFKQTNAISILIPANFHSTVFHSMLNNSWNSSQHLLGIMCQLINTLQSTKAVTLKLYFCTQYFRTATCFDLSRSSSGAYWTSAKHIQDHACNIEHIKCCPLNVWRYISQIYFWDETLHVSNSSSVHHQEFFTVNTAMVYVI